MATQEDTIRSYLADRHNVEIENVKTGSEATAWEAGLYHGEADSWVVYGTMPNTNQDGWFYAGNTRSIAREMAA